MTSYVLDIETEFQMDDQQIFGTNSGGNCFTKYFFKIDNNGNVEISTQLMSYTVIQSKQNVININDNIPIPTYFINIIKALILQTTIKDENPKQTYFEHNKIYNATRQDKGRYEQVYKRYWEMVIDTIVRIKEEIKNIVENPQDNLDIKTQLDTYISKTKQQQEHILEVEKKMEKIQNAYFDTLNDNKKIKYVNNTLRAKITELEMKLNEEISKTNNKKQLDEYNKLEQKRLEDLEKEQVWYHYKLQKNNYNPLNH
jgi:hypothetical protein